MAVTSLVHDRFKLAVVSGPGWSSLTMMAALLLAGTWTPAPTDGYVATAIADGAVEVTAAGYARVTLAGQTTTLDDPNTRADADANTITFPSMASGSSFDTLIVFQFVTDDALSPLAITYSLGATYTTSGATAVFNLDPSGLFVLT